MISPMCYGAFRSLVLATVMLTGCGTATFARGFVDSLDSAVVGGTVRIQIQGGRLVTYAAPISEDQVAEKARRTLEQLEPDGRTLYLAREWGPHGNGFRWEKLVKSGAGDELRSWLINHEGQVLERSYEVPRGDAPDQVMALVPVAGHDSIRRVSFILAQAGSEGWFQILLQDAQGRQRLLRCRADGSEASWFRTLTGEITSGR